MPSVVAAQLAQLSFDLRAVWEGQVGDFVSEQVEPSDLVLDRRLGLFGEGVDEVAHRLEALRIPVVDSLEVVHGTGTLTPPTDAPEHDRPRRHRDLRGALELPSAVYGHGEPAVMRGRAAQPQGASNEEPSSR